MRLWMTTIRREWSPFFTSRLAFCGQERQYRRRVHFRYPFLDSFCAPKVFPFKNKSFTQKERSKWRSSVTREDGCNNCCLIETWPTLPYPTIREGIRSANLMLKSNSCSSNLFSPLPVRNISVRVASGSNLCVSYSQHEHQTHSCIVSMTCC